MFTLNEGENLLRNYFFATAYIPSLCDQIVVRTVEVVKEHAVHLMANYFHGLLNTPDLIQSYLKSVGTNSIVLL